MRPNVANLNYALTHGSSWNVPNPYVGNSLYQSYGRFGGSGLTLVLLIGILIFIKKAALLEWHVGVLYRHYLVLIRVLF